ncbi:hypothetical protein DFH09DRAFT_1081011 [Mycena vulgaris]|nr:hypothetical protein DFH09DRAFT_1081011 [Mycena vulgaris]
MPLATSRIDHPSLPPGLGASDLKGEAHPLAVPREKLLVGAAYWADQVARARASNGLGELHVMVLRKAGEIATARWRAPSRAQQGRLVEFTASFDDLEIPPGTMEIH